MTETVMTLVTLLTLTGTVAGFAFLVWLLMHGRVERARMDAQHTAARLALAFETLDAVRADADRVRGEAHALRLELVGRDRRIAELEDQLADAEAQL